MVSLKSMFCRKTWFNLCKYREISVSSGNRIHARLLGSKTFLFLLNLWICHVWVARLADGKAQKVVGLQRGRSTEMQRFHGSLQGEAFASLQLIGMVVCVIVLWHFLVVNVWRLRLSCFFLWIVSIGSYLRLHDINDCVRAFQQC